MAMTDNNNKSPRLLFDTIPWISLLVWGGLLLAVYALHEFFFVILTTFLLSFAVHQIVVRLSSRLHPGKESPGLERWLTLASFTMIVLVIWAVISVLGPRFIEQGHLMLVRAQQVRPANTLNNLLNRTVGAYLFHHKYGDPVDPRYQQGLKNFQEKNRYGEGAFTTFYLLQSDLKIGFELHYERTVQQRLSDDLPKGGTASENFEHWFLRAKAPALFTEHREAYLARWTAALDESTDANTAIDEPASRAVTDDRDREIYLMILQDVRVDNAKLVELEREWEEMSIARAWRQFTASPEYHAAFEQYYQQQRENHPGRFIFDYQTYVSLSKAYAQGKEAFLAAFQDYMAKEKKFSPAHLQQDFEVAIRRRLSQEWWSTDPAAISLRSHLRQEAPQVIEGMAKWVETAMTHFVSIPAQLLTSLLLTIFITLDMIGLKQGARRLGTSRIAPIYNEIVPNLVVFGRLIGRSFSAQGLIAICNTLLTFTLLWSLGIQNELLLSGIVFFASFVPVLGVFIAGVPIILQAILQPDGSMMMALLAMSGILLIHLLETAVLSPRIIGKVLHLHPVMILVIIVIGEHLFGLWGLLLGVPVTVYILRVAMLKESIPGIYEPTHQDPV